MGLEKLDLSNNQLASNEEVVRLTRLPFLDDLWLRGNPVAQQPSYRKDVYLHFCKEVSIAALS
jgi:hypothetical protein